MTSLYKETQQTGELVTWKAMASAVLINPAVGFPSMRINEVERTSFNGVIVSDKATRRNLVIVADNEQTKIPFINTETYEQIVDENGNPIDGYCFTVADFMNMVACAYIHAGTQLDKLENAAV